MICYQCNAQMEIIKDRPYEYKSCGLDNVVIYGVPQYKCPHCAEFYVSIPKIKQLHQLIGMTLCCQDEKLSGKEIRFLRKEVRLKQIDFASVLSIAPETLSRYENNHESPSETTDKLIRTSYLNMAKGAKEVTLEVDWYELLKRVATRPVDPKKIIALNPGEWLDNIIPLSCTMPGVAPA